MTLAKSAQAAGWLSTTANRVSIGHNATLKSSLLLLSLGWRWQVSARPMCWLCQSEWKALQPSCFPSSEPFVCWLQCSNAISELPATATATATADCHMPRHAHVAQLCNCLSVFLLRSVLRNLAMLTARTELVMLGDLDMLIGADLREVVSNADKWVLLTTLEHTGTPVDAVCTRPGACRRAPMQLRAELPLCRRSCKLRRRACG